MKVSHQNYAAFVVVLLSASAWGQSSLQAEHSINSRHTFTPAQRAEIEARDLLAQTIAANVEADAQTRNDQQWRVRLMGTLYGVTSPNLRDIANQARTVDQAQVMAGKVRQSGRSSRPNIAKSLTDLDDDLVFTPKTPCRFVDTRNVGGPIPKGGSAFTTFDTEQVGSVYGGDASCFLPGDGEISIAANVTVTVDSGAAGFLGIRPHGSTTRSSLVNWLAGGTTGVANAAIIATAQDSDNHYKFDAYAGGNTPYLIVDLFGYFAPALPTALDCTTVGPSAATLASHQETTSASSACPTGYSVVSPLCEGVAAYVLSSGVQVSGQNAFCSFSNQTANPTTVEIGAVCCRVP